MREAIAMNDRRWIERFATASLILSCAFGRFAVAGGQQVTRVERWGVAELTWKAKPSENPYLDTTLSAVFRQGSVRKVVPGFYDGSGKFKVRFSPPSVGRWTYQTESNLDTLSGRTGELTAVPPTDDNHGPIRVFKTFYLQYADGTPYHQFGTTCYAWIHQAPELQKQTLKTLAGAPFNKIRFCVFPKSYSYNQNEPERFAFRKRTDGSIDFDRPDEAFWHHLERRILDLQKLGIEADLILWHPYDRWHFANMTDPQDDRYLRYAIARLSAYRNVWWSLANEYDFMTNQKPGHAGNKQPDDWDRFFEILEREDSHQRMRGIHNGRIWYDHTRRWVTHASLQTSNMAGGIGYRQKYRKPVIFDECKYEGNIPQGWGNLTAREMVQRFWLGTMSGCYIGHGETYLHPKDILWWSKGGVLHGDSPARIAWLKQFMAAAPPFDSLKPVGDDRGNYLLADTGKYYLLYCANTQPRSLTLDGHRPYKIDRIDPWAMTVTPLGTAPPGDFTVRPAQSDLAFRFQPYADGEPLRPAAKIISTKTAGAPPLTVSLRYGGPHQVEWTLPDGSHSDARQLQRTFENPGLYWVKMLVTDGRGAQAASFLPVRVDRNVEEPIMRVGFRAGERPVWQLGGTARRSSAGRLSFPDGEPWGWASAGDSALESLRGLHSFTIMGWLKPDSLRAGSGGNRILFCLNRDHSGIDLVCHENGSMRLSVNQWPDKISNDSSPGQLVVGKWTGFAVTYDGTGTEQDENVCWYFTDPCPEPGAETLRLDRKTRYPAGPVAEDIGPLAIGNFNQTMKWAGFDRQFRGQIARLQVFGSRVSNVGAFSAKAIAAHRSAAQANGM